MIVNLKNTEETPEMIEQTAEAVAVGKRVYKTNMIYLGSWLGGPLVAGYLIAENFKAFGEFSKAKKTWIYTVLGIIILFGGIYLIPEKVLDAMPSFLIPLIYTSIAYSIARHYQEKNIAAFVVSGGKPFGAWRTVAVSFIGLALTFALVIGVVYLFYDYLFYESAPIYYDDNSPYYNLNDIY